MIENIENFLEDIRKELTIELSKFIDLAMEVMSSGEVLLKEILFENEEDGGTESGEKKISSILELKQTISDVIESLFLKHELFEIKEPIEVLAGDEISVSIQNPDSKLILELSFYVYGNTPQHPQASIVNNIIGFTNRYMEYKTCVNKVHGSFNSAGTLLS